MADEQIIIELIARVDKLEAGMKKAESTTSFSMSKMMKGFLAVGAALTGVVAMLKKATDAALAQDRADNMLMNSLKRIGESDAFSRLAKQANDYQKSTTYADDITEKAQQRLIDFGINSETALKLIPAAMDLAASRGIDLQAAVDIVARAAKGMGVNVRTAGFSMEEVNAKGGKLQGTLAMVQERFGGAAEAAGKTFSGQMAILKNKLDDIMEKLGMKLLPMIMKIVDILESNLPDVELWLEDIGELLAWLGDMIADIFGKVDEEKGGLLRFIRDIGEGISTIMSGALMLFMKIANVLSKAVLGKEIFDIAGFQAYRAGVRGELSGEVQGPEAPGGGGSAPPLPPGGKGGGGIPRPGFKEPGIPISLEGFNEFAYSARELDRELARIPKDLDNINLFAAKLVPTLKDLGGQVSGVLYEAFGGFIDDILAPLKIQLDESANAFEKFGARVVNGIIDIVAQFATQALAVGGIVTLLNLISPGLGTGFASFIFGSGAAAGGGGILTQLGAFLGFDDYRADSWLKRQGTDIAHHFWAGLQREMSPFLAGMGGGRAITVYFPDPVGAFAEAYEGAPEASRIRLGNKVRKATAVSKRGEP